MTAEELITRLDLLPHPEGGHYRETFRDASPHGERAASTAIYFLLRAGEKSRSHRIDAVEVWHWYAGAPLRLRIIEGGISREAMVGNAIERGERPQIIVPAHAWQSAETTGDYTLAGCTVAPGFEFAGFELS